MAASFPDYTVISVMFYVLFKAPGPRGCWLFYAENEFPVLFFAKENLKYIQRHTLKCGA